MKFNYAGETYKLEFSRIPKTVPTKHGPISRTQTIVRLLNLSEGYEVGKAVVSPHPYDDDTREGGRQAALKKLTQDWWHNEMRGIAGQVMWTYFNRSHTPDIKALTEKIERLTRQRDTLQFIKELRRF